MGSLKTDSVEFTTRKPLKSLTNDLRQAINATKAQVDQLEDDPLAGDNIQPQVAVLLSGHSLMVGTRMWGVQVYLYDLGDRRVGELVALGEGLVAGGSSSVNAFDVVNERLYEAAADCVLTLLKRHEIDPCNLQHIEEYYELLYSYADGDKRSLREAISNEDFQAVQEQYRIIPDATVQVVVPYGEKMKLFKDIRRELDENGLSRSLLRKAKPITLSTYERDKAECLCERLYFRAPGGELTATDFYILHNAQYYDERAGLNFALPFNGII